MLDLGAARDQSARIGNVAGDGFVFFALKIVVSAILIAIVSGVARRQPAFGALIASLPLVSVLGMVWLWLETRDPARMETHVEATFWYVLPSLPMFLAIPAMMRAGVPFYAALIAGCGLTFGLYTLLTWVCPRFGLNL